LQALQAEAQAIADSFAGEAQRVWQVPAVLDTALTDVPNLHEPAWQRQPINANYASAMQSDEPGTVGDIIGLKQQIDYNAAEERAFRYRHATLCRCLAHQHGRRHGHATSDLFPYVVKQVQDSIKAGGAR
jgi:hypothetical protein